MDALDWWKAESKRIWYVCREKKFTVEVVAWHSESGWHWNVYAYVFEGHDLFSRPEVLIGSAPLHGGCTLDKRTTSEPALGIRYDWQRKNTTIQIGSDYGHYGDEAYANFGPEHGIPPAIVDDANELAAWLKQEAA